MHVVWYLVVSLVWGSDLQQSVPVIYGGFSTREECVKEELLWTQRAEALYKRQHVQMMWIDWCGPSEDLPAEISELFYSFPRKRPEPQP